MAVIITPPQHPAGDPGTLDYLSAQLRWMDWNDGYWDDGLHRRLIQLEEALVDRKARRRLRREIRGSVRMFSWAGSSFHARRVEATFNEYSVAMNKREDRSAQ